MNEPNLTGEADELLDAVLADTLSGLLAVARRYAAARPGERVEIVAGMRRYTTGTRKLGGLPGRTARETDRLTASEAAAVRACADALVRVGAGGGDDRVWPVQ